MLSNTEPLGVIEAATSKVILIVEDDDANAEVLLQVLVQETPYRVYLAPDGPGALQCINQTTPDLFILDYRLPGMNGIELYYFLHAHARVKQTPALILSAFLEHCKEEIEIRKLLSLAKPFDVGDLLSLIAKVFAHSSDCSSQQPIPQASS